MLEGDPPAYFHFLIFLSSPTFKAPLNFCPTGPHSAISNPRLFIPDEEDQKEERCGVGGIHPSTRPRRIRGEYFGKCSYSTSCLCVILSILLHYSFLLLPFLISVRFAMGSLGIQHPNIYIHIYNETLETEKRENISLLPINLITLKRKKQPSNLTFMVRILAKALLAKSSNEYSHDHHLSHVGKYSIYLFVSFNF